MLCAFSKRKDFNDILTSSSDSSNPDVINGLLEAENIPHSKFNLPE